MSIEPQDFQLKYDGTVLVHVYVRADQDVAKLQKNVIRAAQGPRLDAIVAWSEIYARRRKLGVKAKKFGDSRGTVEKFLQNSERDVVVFHLCVNTNTDPCKLGENIRRAARGPRLDDVVSVVEIYDGHNGSKVWDNIQQVVRRAHADPAARSFPL